VADGKGDPRLAELGARIDAAKRARQPERREGTGKFSGAEFAWRMVIDLAAGIVIGCGMGYGIDTLAGTMPVFLIVFTLLGFAAGIRIVMRSARDYQERLSRSGAAAGNDEVGPPGPGR
jgi:ATP synthase protein I